MSDEQFEKLQNGQYIVVPKWEYYLKYVSLLGIVYLIFYIGAWSKKQEASVLNHIQNEDEHRSLRQAQEEFVTRREFNMLENSLKKIDTNLEEIKKAVK